ncbi:MAG TPA: cell wall-binding repeat-containing protein, partial [Cryobacterium sp.]|nr:cell wall-binding repeat-containing protein [Cryobacterium sp.]
ASPTYTQATWTTDVIPPGTTGISFGLNLIQNGTLVTDDYALYNTVGAPDAGAPSVVSTSRLSGVDRYATAVEVSKSGFAPGVARVYVATGYNFPDALSAAPAAARAKSPVLLTDQGTLPDVVRDEIRRLKPAQIVVVGGAPSVSEAVFAQLKALAPAVRIAGDDRYATSRAIAKDAFGTTGARTAYIATGTNFPDALAAGPAAARYDGPILLVPGNATTLDAATRALIEELGITQVRIAGGTPSLSAGIEAGIRDTRGVTAVSRFAGADRLATAAAINRDAFPTGDTIYLAMSTNFPDALVGSALAGLQGRPLFLTQTQCTDQGVLDGIKRMGATKVVLLGGTPSLSEAVARLAPC